MFAMFTPLFMIAECHNRDFEPMCQMMDVKEKKTE
jgi:hypothetical protein